MTGTLDDAIKYVQKRPISLAAKEQLESEGLVCKPVIEVRDRQGKRIAVKIKVKDFFERGKRN